jgi:hypothetical protein
MIKVVGTGHVNTRPTATMTTSTGSGSSSSNWGLRCVSRAQVCFFFLLFLLTTTKSDLEGQRKPMQAHDSQRRLPQAHDSQCRPMQANDSNRGILGGSRHDTSRAPGIFFSYSILYSHYNILQAVLLLNQTGKGP